MFDLKHYAKKNWKIVAALALVVVVTISGAVTISGLSKKEEDPVLAKDPNSLTDVVPEDAIDASTEALSDEEISSTESVVDDVVEPTETVAKPIEVDVDLPDGYTKMNKEVRVLADVHLREKASPYSSAVAILKTNDIATLVGENKNGWSAIVTENGTVGYLASYYLSPTTTPVYTEVNEVVYATKDANVRSSGSIQAKQIGDITKNTALIRTGIGDNGWSKVIYNGEEAYVYSLYLTTESPNANFVDTANYKEVDETVYAATKVNIRMGPGSSFATIGTLTKGESIQRIGVGDNGWSKVLYNGQEGYMYTKYLTTKGPK